VSSATFLLLMIPTGLALLGAFWLAGKLLQPLIGIEASNRRLRYRLERRLARGEDRYFEELRSIETALEHNDKRLASSKARKRPWPDWVTIAAAAMFGAAFLLPLIAPSLGLGVPPIWTNRLSWAALTFIGLTYLREPASAGFETERSGRMMGWVFLVTGGLIGAFTIFDLFRSGAFGG